LANPPSQVTSPWLTFGNLTSSMMSPSIQTLSSPLNSSFVRDLTFKFVGGSSLGNYQGNYVPTGGSPCARHSTSFVVNTNFSYGYIYGGIGPAGETLGDFWQVKLDTLQWAWLIPSPGRTTTEPRHTGLPNTTSIFYHPGARSAGSFLPFSPRKSRCSLFAFPSASVWFLPSRASLILYGGNFGTSYGNDMWEMGCANPSLGWKLLALYPEELEDPGPRAFSTGFVSTSEQLYLCAFPRTTTHVLSSESFFF